MANWTFFTNHGHVLFVLAQFPDLTIREISFKVGITQRQTQKIIAELIEGNFIQVTKIGRNNHYKVNGKKRLRHPIEEKCQIKQLVGVITEANFHQK